jgi:uncharacterized protein YndB with AHSA1/START domain
MSDPVIVEIVIGATADTVWRALREPAEIRRWFGWDYEGIDDEIQEIFHTDATVDETARSIEFGAKDRIELEARGDQTVVRLVRAAPAGQAGWDGIYDEINEGWLSFLQVLRFVLERHPGEQRRARHYYNDGEEWFRSEHQRGVVNADGDLVITTPRRVIVSSFT